MNGRLKSGVLSLAEILTLSSIIRSSTAQGQLLPPDRPRHFLSSTGIPYSGEAGAGNSSPLRFERNYGNLPLVFEPNVGQTGQQVRFFTRSGGMTLFFTDTEAVLIVSRSKKQERDRLHRLETPPELEQATLRMKFVRAHKPRQVLGLEKLPGITNYFIGDDPKKWRTNIPTYRRLEYQGIYPGVDLAYYGNQGRLEYDLIVAPGADPGLLELAFEGAESVRMDSRGNLTLHTATGQVSLRRPLIYQERDGLRQGIAGHYVLRDRQHVAFRVDRYDSTRPLVIDPVLVYSTFLGPRGGDNEAGAGIAVDAAGNAYVTGISKSIATTPESFQVAPNGSGDAFITKLNATGTTLIYSTYLGGSSWEGGTSIAVDPSGNAYVTGVTYSHDFPTTPGALQRAYGGDGELSGDSFIAKLNATGTALLYSTYLGGSDGDIGYGIAIDVAGNAYVAGRTCSDNFPTTQGAFQHSYGGGELGCSRRDAFVTKLSATGSTLVYSTYLGGDEQDIAASVAVDTAGYAYVTGTSSSTNFPFTRSASGADCRAGSDRYNSVGFVTKLSATGGSVIYSVCLAETSGSGIAVTSTGNVFVTGGTDPNSFPTTPGAFRGAGADFNLFVLKLDGTGSVLYATGLGRGEIAAIAVDLAGNAYVTGYTYYDDFPVTSDSIHVDRQGHPCAFLTKFNASGTALLYSTLFGNTSATATSAIAADSSGNVYVTGLGGGSDFPNTWGAFRTVGGGTFVAKFADRPSASTLGAVSAASFFIGSPLAPGSIASVFGQGLAPTAEATSSLSAPASLAGTKVLIKDSGGTESAAPLFFVSPVQINCLIPDTTTTGPAVVTVVNGDRQVGSGHLLIGKVGPGLFTANSDGKGVAAAVGIKVAADGTQTSQLVFRCGTTAGSCVSVPIDLGSETDETILALFGTGIRRTSGMSVYLGGYASTVLFAGAQGQYSGLDQVNVRLPRNLVGRGEVDVRLRADGLEANTVMINIK